MPASERSSSARSVLVLGCGDLGIRLAAQLPATWRLTGVRRDPTALPPGIQALAADYTQSGSLQSLADLAPDYVVTTLKPTGRDAAGYETGFTRATENLLAGLGGHRPRAVLMVSSTRVYAEHDGGWVDENSPLATGDPAARAIIDAEAELLASGHNASVIRCGGIYGEPQGRLLSRVAGGDVTAAEPLRYSNRIHRDDVAGLLAFLLRQVEEGGELAPVYLGVDNCPAPQHVVEAWLAQQLGVPATATRAPATGHKRCHNQVLSASGYLLRYPDYRSGYAAVLAAREQAC
ncbi:NAD(P)H-binding protein [Parahaliea maris]|uniref:NAD(P)H-binding protein n=1 Tax=Parahaliea maris TaxID=2716870 RepID=A0A5C8ZYX6_9GAMM|nr:NAD(P)H-binding protein [Parahaliea maris]TXS93785.1 NAD(P)H-binding protein [Parahaliea maris]